MAEFFSYPNEALVKKEETVIYWEKSDREKERTILC